MTPTPRLFCIPATDAPIVAVIRRGPTEWSHVGRWNTDDGDFEPGAWFKGRLFPQKCDLSPDGRWLLYSAMKPGSDWAAGDIYEAVSRLPWLHALAAWEAGTTYTRGAYFADPAEGCALGKPDVGDPSPLLRRYGVALNRPVQFCVERRRGWTETEASEPRDSSDMWDERRTVRMRKPRPSGGGAAVALEVGGSFAAFRSSPDHRQPAEYSLVTEHDLVPLSAQWADWTADGRLLVALDDGRLQVRKAPYGSRNIQSEHDLRILNPKSIPPPEWALEW